MIRRVFEENWRVNGVRKVFRQFVGEGFDVPRCTVARFMKGVDTGLEVRFCDLQSSWQRGSNENTNALLRQYIPRAESLTKNSVAQPSPVAHALYTRPRKAPGSQTPAEALGRLLKPEMIDGVATTD